MTQVTLLTTTECHLCDHAKEVLQRVAMDHPMDIEEVPFGTERGRRLAQETNLVFPPGVLVDGQPFSYGRLSERKLRRLLSGLPRTAHLSSPL